ncbi:MAG: NfeD family protein [Bdellovibrionaceae bacterium]|nr:NfeD family protein [Pseudobdellovibrionaceae bacterium]
MDIHVFDFHMTAWQVAVTIGLLFMIAEVFVPGFVMFPIGLAFMATAPITLWVDSFAGQIAVLAGLLIVTFVIFHKLIPRTQPHERLSNVDDMIGKTATVEVDIDNDANAGYVKLYGDSWRAVNLEDGTIGKGSKVKIEQLDGNKVLVRKI